MITQRDKNKDRMMKGLKNLPNFAKGGGVETKGKTKGKMVKMAKGGAIDGVAVRGKTRLPFRAGK